MTGPNTNLFLISGCSSGGKSSLLTHLRAQGFATVAEPGRRIIAEERKGAGHALPWRNLRAFAERALAMGLSDLEAATSASEPVFFDRGVVDAAVALEHTNGPAVRESLGAQRHYAIPVFIAPPWPEIYVQDADRAHGFDAAVEEFDRLMTHFAALGYETCLLPKQSVAERAQFVLARLGLS
ncbi:AAA family ATPase [Tateyamaria omphalii]|uniref:AAA family ATPase n=1 Tax=Tateyamaria omphalii TaxID=299262 RepID=UPI0021BD30A3|nr:AAA family ATPase [Tateyamaria omphalii]